MFVPLFVAHIESTQTLRAGYGGLVIHADYTHSIVGMLILSAALGAMFLPKLGRRVAIVIALVSASHSVLVHRADMPVLPKTSAAFRALDLACAIIRWRQLGWDWSWYWRVR